ncbi:MAG: SusD/RagB family nutrient-binding outer membrane lipoprotein [Prevotella sp.]|nr:SusD/RagB family nutrient-binding outer membrane lipoprotein [Prevotella sp.]
MKIKYLFGIALASMLFVSCSEDMLDRINEDETSKTADKVGAKFQLTDAEVATAYSTVNGAYAWYVSSYTEQMFGTGNNQMMKAETRNPSETASAATFNNEWNSTYSNLNNIYQMIEKCSEGGIDEGKDDLLGMAQILYALNWGVLTDLHGDIPFSECFTEVSAPKVESQETIYNAIFDLLDAAQVNLAKGGKNAGEQDIIYGGDTDAWAALGHAVKARYLLHTYGRNKSVLSQVISEAQAAIDGGFAGFYLDIFNGVTADNAWSAYQWSRYYIGSSQTVIDLMEERDDPRVFYYNFDIGGSQAGIPGDQSLASLVEELNEPLWLENGAANLAIFSESEIYFILAEAQALAGQDATDAFETAVASNLKEYFNICDDEIDDADVADYIAGIQPLFTADQLKEIRIQKYLAQTRGEVIETYNDMRRIIYAEGSYPVAMTNPNNSSSVGNRWPLRLPYGDSDVVSNPNVAAAFGSGNDAGMYVFTENVWWAGGSR